MAKLRMYHVVARMTKAPMHGQSLMNQVHVMMKSVSVRNSLHCAASKPSCVHRRPSHVGSAACFAGAVLGTSDEGNDSALEEQPLAIQGEEGTSAM
eukprot:126687-Amphidinium_carterae.2